MMVELTCKIKELLLFVDLIHQTNGLENYI